MIFSHREYRVATVRCHLEELERDLGSLSPSVRDELALLIADTFTGGVLPSCECIPSG